MVEKGKLGKEAEGEEAFVIGLGFCGCFLGANSAVTDVKDGKIKVFEPQLKSSLPPYSLGYKKRVYSPNRVMYPLKRVDFDPNGDRNVENRGKSRYVRISWDEALDIIVGEIKRIKEKYGTTAILAQGDGHGEDKVVHGTHGCSTRLLNLLGGYTFQIRNPDSWEGWFWGAKHAWGMEPVGQMKPQENLMLDVAENTKLFLFWGCDPETTPWGWQAQTASRLKLRSRGSC